MDGSVATVKADGTKWVSDGDTDIDMRLIRAVASGDRQALEDMYTRHGQSLLHYLLHFTSDMGIAEELLQDTFMAVWQNARTYRGDARLRTWLFGIARRRAGKRLRRSEPLWAEMAELEDLPAPDLEPEPALLSSVAREEVTHALGQLMPAHREILLLIFVYDLSYAEIAEILEVPLGTVKSRLWHAKRCLRTILKAREEVDQ